MTAFDLSTFVNFSPEGRCVNWLYRSEQCDILLVGWEPGQSSSYHDHLDSESVVFVISGHVTVISEDERQRFSPGNVIVTPKGARHQLINNEAERLITLHLYSPCLQTPISPPLNIFTELGQQKIGLEEANE
jgi:cysteine dioxygenase